MNRSQRIQAYWDRQSRNWVAYYTDSLGQLGEAQYAATRDGAVFALGLEMGRNPQRFSRPFAEYKMTTT
jgi:hypothetical protein